MRKRYTLWYILSGLALVAILALAIIINNNYGTTNLENATSSLDTDNGDLKINWDRYPSYEIELKDTLTITQSGTYHLTGSLIDDNIIINVSDGVVKIILDNVNIQNSTGPAIACYLADDLVIELVGDNTLSDGKTYSADYDEDVKGAIYSKSDLTFQGEGTLNLTANYQDAIVSKDDLKFNNGIYNISAADDAIRGKDSVYIVDGDFSITAKSDAIKSTNETDAGKGFVLIESGDITINSGDDGIHAIRTLVINNGKINIEKSYEGLEAQVITINGGEVSIIANDDGINAGGGSDTTTTTNDRRNPGAMDVNTNCILTINGGNIYINASGDGVDSNGYIYFNGGNVVVDGPTNNGNGALDSGAGIIMHGGTAIAVGSNGMAETLGSTSSVYNISVYFASSQAAGTKIEIKDSTNNTILSHTSAKAFAHMAAGSDKFNIGETYTIYINGKKYQDFTITDTTTTVGNNNGNINQNMMPGPNNRR